MSDIKATGSLTKEAVSAVLQLGSATLTLFYPRDDDQAVEDMVELVQRAEDAFTDVLEALIEKAQEESRG
jgi:hypothetical protein